MKKTILAIFVILGLVSTTPAFAEGKIAVVDVQAVVTKSKQVQDLKKEHTKQVDELQKWIKTVNADVAKQKTEEGKQKLTAKYSAELLKKKDEISKDYQKKLHEIDKEISNTIIEEAKARGYDMVIAKSIVLYGGEDITNEVIKALK